MRAKRGKIVERLAHGHPRIKGDGIRHVGQARFDGDFVALRVQAENADGAGRGPEQIEQALDGRRLARSIAAEKSVTASGADGETESIHGVQFAVAPYKVLDLDDGDGCVAHGFSFGCFSVCAALFSKKSSRSLTRAKNSSRPT